MIATLSTGESLTFPVVSRDLNQFVVAYLASREAVRALLPRDLVPSDDGYGLTRVYLYWLEAAASDFGAYCEMAMTLPVREPYFGREALYYYANPVTTEAARNVGRELWGNPCVLGTVDIHHDGDTSCGTLTMDGDFVLSLSCRPARGAPGRETGLLSTGADFPRQQRSEVYRYAQIADGYTRDERPVHVTLTLGDHPLGQTLAGLLLDRRPLHSTYYTGSTIWSGPRFSDLFNVKH